MRRLSLRREGLLQPQAAETLPVKVVFPPVAPGAFVRGIEVSYDADYEESPVEVALGSRSTMAALAVVSATRAFGVPNTSSSYCLVGLSG